MPTNIWDTFIDMQDGIIRIESKCAQEEVPDMAEFEGQEDDKENGQVRQNSVHLS